MIRRFLCWLFGPSWLLGCPCAMVYGDRRCHIKATRPEDQDECDPPPAFGYVDRTDGDEMLPLHDEPRGQGWLGALMLGALVAAVVAVVWGCR